MRPGIGIRDAMRCFKHFLAYDVDTAELLRNLSTVRSKCSTSDSRNGEQLDQCPAKRKLLRDLHNTLSLSMNAENFLRSFQLRVS